MKFKNGREMYEAIVDADLYNEARELYVFLYNEDGAVCVYNIHKAEAEELKQKSRKYCDCWSAFLGVGGEIYDNPMDFCDHYFLGEWEEVS